MIVTLTARDDFAPVPRVEVRVEPSASYDGGTPGGAFPELSGGSPGTSGPEFDGGTPSTIYVDLPDGTNRVTLWRRCEGRTLKVRGGVDRFYGGSLALLDLEAGLETVSSYELECFQGSVSLGKVSLGDAHLPWTGEAGGVLLQQPLEPRLNAVVVNLQGSWPQINRSSASETVFAQGRSYPTLISGGPIRAISGMAVDFGVRTREQAQKVWGTLGTESSPQLPVWLVRSPKGLLPRVFFGHVSDLTEVDVDLRVGGEWSRFQASLDEVAPPAPALVISPLSYDDLDVSFASYDVMDDAFTSYDARDSAFEYAGASGG